MLAVLPVLFNIQQLSRLISEKSRKKKQERAIWKFLHTHFLFYFHFFTIHFKVKIRSSHGYNSAVNSKMLICHLRVGPTHMIFFTHKKRGKCLKKLCCFHNESEYNV